MTLGAASAARASDLPAGSGSHAPLVGSSRYSRRALASSNGTAITSKRACDTARLALLLTVVLAGSPLLFGVVNAARSRALRGPLIQAIDSHLLQQALQPQSHDPCLCLFDIDRTLTGKQGWSQQCPGDAELPLVADLAYDPGALLVSDLGQHLFSTFCAQCYHGIVSIGNASGSGERSEILKILGGTVFTRSSEWESAGFQRPVPPFFNTSLVVDVVEGTKQDVTASMLRWWQEVQHLEIRKQRVYFFDDVAENVAPFLGSGYNARQVSCLSRGPFEPATPGCYASKIGGCGARANEVVDEAGVHLCGGRSPVDSSSPQSASTELGLGLSLSR